MAQSVSNDALWEKLPEMDKKLNELAATQKSVVPKREQAENKSDLKEVKDEIIAGIKGEIRILGLSNDSHFDANRKNIQQLGEDILKVLNVANRIRKQQRESIEPQKADEKSYFKIRKTSFVIAALSLLVLIFTLFCKKQQSDYMLLVDEYYKQNIAIQKLEGELKVNEEKHVKK